MTCASAGCASDTHTFETFVIDRAVIEGATLTPDQFAGAVGASLAPHDIGVHLDEARDGTRLLMAWRSGAPGQWHAVPLDAIRLHSNEVEPVSARIRSTLDLIVTD